VVGVRGTYVMAETGKARSRADASQGLEYRGEGQQAWSNTKTESRGKGKGVQVAGADAAMGGTGRGRVVRWKGGEEARRERAEGG
jgi:hypothetical protein